MPSSTVGPLFITATTPTIVPSTVVPSSTYGDWHADSFSFQTIGLGGQFILRLVKCFPANSATGLHPIDSPIDPPVVVVVPDLLGVSLTDPVSSTLLISLTNAITVYGNAKGLF